MDFQKEQLLKTALEDKEVQMLVEHNNIGVEILERDFLSVCSFTLNKKKCAGCNSLNECRQEMIGQMPQILFIGNIYYDFIPCPYLK